MIAKAEEIALFQAQKNRPKAAFLKVMQPEGSTLLSAHRRNFFYPAGDYFAQAQYTHRGYDNKVRNKIRYTSRMSYVDKHYSHVHGE